MIGFGFRLDSFMMCMSLKAESEHPLPSQSGGRDGVFSDPLQQQDGLTANFIKLLVIPPLASIIYV